MTVLPTCGSPAELTDLMLIAEGGTEAYNSPRVAADEPDAPPAVAPVQLLREHLLLLDDDRCALDDVQPARQDGDGGSAAALGEATHALSGGFATPSLSAHPAHAGAATPFASGMADGMGHGTSSADAFATIVASTELACARFEPANLNFVDSSTTPSAASSPPRASTSVAAPLDALPCALTQADVAATALQATDSKLEWSWLALANLEVRGGAPGRARRALRRLCSAAPGTRRHESAPTRPRHASRAGGVCEHARLLGRAGGGMGARELAGRHSPEWPATTLASSSRPSARCHRRARALANGHDSGMGTPLRVRCADQGDCKASRASVRSMAHAPPSNLATNFPSADCSTTSSARGLLAFDAPAPVQSAHSATLRSVTPQTPWHAATPVRTSLGNGRPRWAQVARAGRRRRRRLRR